MEHDGNGTLKAEEWFPESHCRKSQKYLKNGNKD